MRRTSVWKRTENFNGYFTALYSKSRNEAEWCFIPMNSSNIRLLTRVQKPQEFPNYHTIPSIQDKFSMHPSVLEYYRAQEELWAWNHEFWLQNNIKYELKKQECLEDIKNNNEMNEQEQLTMFYKRYLDEQRQSFERYHIIWCKKNIYLLILAAKAIFYKCLRRSSYFLSNNRIFNRGAVC